MINKVKLLIVFCLTVLSFSTIYVNALPTEETQKSCSGKKGDNYENYENEYDLYEENNKKEEFLNFSNNLAAALSNNKNSELSNNKFSEISNNIESEPSNNLGADIEEFLYNQHSNNNFNEIIQLEEESFNNNINIFDPQANIKTTIHSSKDEETRILP